MLPIHNFAHVNILNSIQFNLHVCLHFDIKTDDFNFHVNTFQVFDSYLSSNSLNQWLSGFSFFRPMEDWGACLRNLFLIILQLVAQLAQKLHIFLLKKHFT